MFGWLWDCLLLIKVHLGQLPIDTFATDQPTDPFALTRYNDRTFGTRARPIGKADSVSSNRRFPEFRGGGETCGVHYIEQERPCRLSKQAGAAPATTRFTDSTCSPIRSSSSGTTFMHNQCDKQVHTLPPLVMICSSSGEHPHFSTTAAEWLRNSGAAGR